MNSQRILLVDDEDSIIQFLRLLLEEAGYEIEAADSVISGREKLDEGGFDLVLCDIMMPDGNGLDLLK